MWVSALDLRKLCLNRNAIPTSNPRPHSTQYYLMDRRWIQIAPRTNSGHKHQDSSNLLIAFINFSQIFYHLARQNLLQKIKHNYIVRRNIKSSEPLMLLWVFIILFSFVLFPSCQWLNMHSLLFSHLHPFWLPPEIDDNFIAILLWLHYIVWMFYFIAFLRWKQEYHRRGMLYDRQIFRYLERIHGGNLKRNLQFIDYRFYAGSLGDENRSVLLKFQCWKFAFPAVTILSELFCECECEGSLSRPRTSRSHSNAHPTSTKISDPTEETENLCLIWLSENGVTRTSSEHTCGEWTITWLDMEQYEKDIIIILKLEIMFIFWKRTLHKSRYFVLHFLWIFIFIEIKKYIMGMQSRTIICKCLFVYFENGYMNLIKQFPSVHWNANKT